ncbi:hypothetical protein EVAR_57545_1 [Eumeta japonica]|uniref:Uncharacterized protein n=1 Tax=Eumeta variegata TaxID=151549 RepID=A0A4C1XZ55_EUMVA|nr:hypothetical protein EVAR_57545_1 [Eumeta japonica]
MAIAAPSRKPALRIFFTVASNNDFLQCFGKMMDNVSMSRLVYCSTSFTKGSRNTTAADALFFSFLLAGEGDKKPYELPRICVLGVCPTIMNQKSSEKRDVGFRCQPRGCHQPYQTRPIDIEIPWGRDSPTEDPLGSSGRYFWVTPERGERPGS